MIQHLMYKAIFQLSPTREHFLSLLPSRPMPADNRTLLIRSTFSYYGHPARLPRYQFCTFLQKLSVYLQDFDEGRYRNYMDLIMTRYIAPGRNMK